MYSKIIKNVSKISLLYVVLFSFVSPLLANEPNLKDLDQKQKILDRKLEILEENSKDTASVSAGKDGFSLQSKDKQFKLKIRGLVQFDSRFYFKTPADLGQGNDSFIARRVRPTLEGTIFDRFDFKITPDFGGGTTTLVDAYLDTKFIPELVLRVGKFKAPVGLERLQQIAATPFVEFGLPIDLVPNRDLGAELYGSINKGVLEYALGVFNGVVDGGSSDGDTFDGKDIAARVFAKPFQGTQIKPLQKLGFGIAGTYGKQEGTSATSATVVTPVTNLPSYKTGGQQTFFKYITDTTSPGNTVIAKGVVTRLVPQLRYDFGPLGIFGEYVLNSQKVATASAEKTLHHQAWQTAATFVLTGEDASYKGVSPKKPFNPSKNQWGAVELAARYDELRIDKDAFPVFAKDTASAQRARSFTGGINWYLNDAIKFVANYEHTLFGGGAKSVGDDRPAEKALFARTQLNF